MSDKFSTRQDAERLRSIARGMSYNDIGESTWKHVLFEIAMRLDTGGYNTNDAASKIAEQDARIKELEQQLEVARKYAERWQAICNLWFSCSELKLIQKEDGGYSICEMEFVDNLLVSDFCGDTPEHTIDAAIRQIGGAE